MTATKRPAGFAKRVERTVRYHPDLMEFGIGFQCPPEVLSDPKRFHLGCETMRLAMLASLRKRGPINLWRIGQVNVMADETTKQFLLTLRARAARTLRSGWSSKHRRGIDVPPLPEKLEGGSYTIVSD